MCCYQIMRLGLVNGSRAQNLITSNPGLSQLPMPVQGLMQMRCLCWVGYHKSGSQSSTIRHVKCFKNKAKKQRDTNQSTLERDKLVEQMEDLKNRSARGCLT